MLKDFYNGKRVFLTGHTGFKGAWMCKMLLHLGAQVTGYALEPPTQPSAFEILRLSNQINSIIGDVRDFEHLLQVYEQSDADVVIHMAAQPIVRESFVNPVYTYAVNVMGSVHILECLRKSKRVVSFVNVTTDKVYKNNEWVWGYREIDELNGYDPYSNSKSCSELATDSYRKSFFADRDTVISTARAGNVIGGGDFAKDRIIPDCVRAALAGKNIGIRNPNSIRPYQHVLEPVCAYLKIAQAQYENPELQDSYNIGPDLKSCVTTGELANLFCRAWGNIKTEIAHDAQAVHEANYLRLDCSRAREILGIVPKWSIQQAVEKTVEWTKCWQSGGDINACTQTQIAEYLACE